MKVWLESYDLCVCDLLRYRIDEVGLLDNCGHSAASCPGQRNRAAAFNVCYGQSAESS